MASIILYGILLAILLTLMFVKYFRHHARKQLNAKLDVSTTQLRKPAFRCVEIKTDGLACEHVKSLQNKRILVEFAPLVPLNNCDAAQCNCRYVRYNDRRSGIDRRHMDELNKQVIAYGDKRHTPDRRRHSIAEALA